MSKPEITSLSGDQQRASRRVANVEPVPKGSGSTDVITGSRHKPGITYQVSPSLSVTVPRQETTEIKESPAVSSDSNPMEGEEKQSPTWADRVKSGSAVLTGWHLRATEVSDRVASELARGVSGCLTLPKAIEKTRIGLYCQDAAEDVSLRLFFSGSPSYFGQALAYFALEGEIQLNAYDQATRKQLWTVERFASCLVRDISAEDLSQAGSEAIYYALGILVSVFEETKDISFAASSQVLIRFEASRKKVKAAFNTAFGSEGDTIMGVIDSLLRARMRKFMRAPENREKASYLAKFLIPDAGTLAAGWSRQHWVDPDAGKVLPRGVEKRPKFLAPLYPSFNTSGPVTSTERALLANANKDLANLAICMNKKAIRDLYVCDNYKHVKEMFTYIEEQVYKVTDAVNKELRARKSSIREACLERERRRISGGVPKDYKIPRAHWLEVFEEQKDGFNSLPAIMEEQGYKDLGLAGLLANIIPACQKKLEDLRQKEEALEMEFPELGSEEQ